MSAQARAEDSPCSDEIRGGVLGALFGGVVGMMSLTGVYSHGSITVVIALAGGGGGRRVTPFGSEVGASGNRGRTFPAGIQGVTGGSSANLLCSVGGADFFAAGL